MMQLRHGGDVPERADDAVQQRRGEGEQGGQWQHGAEVSVVVVTHDELSGSEVEDDLTYGLPAALHVG